MLKIKPLRQTQGMCGPYSFKMVLGYYGKKVDAKKIAQVCAADKYIGTSGKSLVSGAKKMGLNAFIKDRASFADIKKYVIDQKIPVIVDWFSEDDGHYSVVVHIDGKNIYLADPELGDKNVIDLETFKRVWFDFEGPYIKSPKDIIIRRIIVIYPED